MNGLFHIIRQIDLAAYHYLSRFSGNWALDRIVAHQESNELLKAGIFLASYWYFWFAPGAERDHRRKKILGIFLGTSISIVVARVLGAVAPFVVRPGFNPALEHHLSVPIPAFGSWNSFPSDTAAYLAALALGLIYLSRRLAIPVIVYTLVGVCLPRIYLQLHYTSDVVAGVAIGVIAVWAVLRADWQHSRLAGGVLSLVETKPHLFYPAAFLVTFEMSKLFWDVRSIEHGLLRLAPIMPLLVVAAVAMGVLATALATTYVRRSKSRTAAGVPRIVMVPSQGSGETQGVEMELPATVLADGRIISAKLRDISLARLYINTEIRLREDASVEVLLELPHGTERPMARCYGRVVSSEAAATGFAVIASVEHSEGLTDLLLAVRTAS